MAHVLAYPEGSFRFLKPVSLSGRCKASLSMQSVFGTKSPPKISERPLSSAALASRPDGILHGVWNTAAPHSVLDNQNNARHNPAMADQWTGRIDTVTSETHTVGFFAANVRRCLHNHTQDLRISAAHLDNHVRDLRERLHLVTRRWVGCTCRIIMSCFQCLCREGFEIVISFETISYIIATYCSSLSHNFVRLSLQC